MIRSLKIRGKTMVLGLISTAAAVAVVLAFAVPAPAAPPATSGTEVLALSGGTSGGTIDLPVSQFSISMENVLASQSSGAGAGKVVFNPLTVTTQVDSNTPLLMQSSRFREATLTVPAADGGVDTLDFGLVAVKSISITGSGTGPATETIQFEYGAVRITHGAGCRGANLELRKC